MSTFAFPGHAGRGRAALPRDQRPSGSRSREPRRRPARGPESWPAWTDDVRLTVPGPATEPIAEALFWGDSADDGRFAPSPAAKGR
jgi:hypothetical protein